jgi:predicted nucleic-acid-binding protein
MRAVDTNVLVRIIARDDDRQVRAAEQYVEKGAWVSTLVLVEAVWVLVSVYRRSAAQVVDIVDGLLNHNQLTLQDSDAVASALAHCRARPALGFSDCLILELARKAGHVPLGTFDRNLAKLDGAQRL